MPVHILSQMSLGVCHTFYVVIAKWRTAERVQSFLYLILSVLHSVYVHTMSFFNNYLVYLFCNNHYTCTSSYKLIILFSSPLAHLFFVIDKSHFCKIWTFLYLIFPSFDIYVLLSCLVNSTSHLLTFWLSHPMFQSYHHLQCIIHFMLTLYIIFLS